MANSAKFAYLRTLLKQMIDDDDPASAPEDGSGKRHAIVLCSS